MDLGGFPDLLFIFAPKFFVCGTSLFCEDPSAPCRFSLVSDLSHAFCLKLGGVFSYSRVGVVASPYNTLGKPLRLCLWKVINMVWKSYGNVCTMSNNSS
jgi:hypothetical protein